MIIDNFDVESIAMFEAKANSPLAVDTYTPLPKTIMAESFQVVRWW